MDLPENVAAEVPQPKDEMHHAPLDQIIHITPHVIKPTMEIMTAFLAIDVISSAAATGCAKLRAAPRARIIIHGAPFTVITII
jgi:hypothetical protein